MIRITNAAHQRRFKADEQEIALDHCAVKLMHLSVIGADIYAHGARVLVVWGTKNAAGEFVEASAAGGLVFEEFSLANVREEKRMEFFQAPGKPTEQREVIVRPASSALEALLTPQPGQADRRFGDVRMRDFENWLVATGRIEGVVE